MKYMEICPGVTVIDSSVLPLSDAAMEVMFYLASVCLSVCLFVC